MEIKKREGHQVIISDEARIRIDNSECPACGLHKRQWTRRTDWRCCSTKCTQKYVKEMVVFGWREMRLKAFERDKFTCVHCKKTPKKKAVCTNGFYKTGKELLDYYKNYNLSYPNPTIISENPPTLEHDDPTQLIGDHIKPIAIGGEQWELDNVQTLCIECDKVKTKQDQGDIAEFRRRIKLKKVGQRFL